MFLEHRWMTWIPRMPVLLVVIAGCDDRVTQIAREAADRQAQQNTAMVQLNQEVAGGAHQLVEGDAQARKDFVAVHHDLQTERSKLDTGWDSLEDERRELAGQRRAESWLTSMTTIIGGVLLTALLLGFCRHALFAARCDEWQAELNELLLAEIISDEPKLGLGGSQPLLTRPELEVCQRVARTPPP
jgi:hypothetical protein